MAWTVTSVDVALTALETFIKTHREKKELEASQKLLRAYKTLHGEKPDSAKVAKVFQKHEFGFECKGPTTPATHH